MTLAELSARLEERGANLQIHWSNPEWTVMLYAADDPAAAFFMVSNAELDVAVSQALDEWDHPNGPTMEVA